MSHETPGFFGVPSLHTDLPLVTSRVVALSDALRTSILPLAGVVLIAAVALVGGAGSYWVDRRRTEFGVSLGAGRRSQVFSASKRHWNPCLQC